MPWQHRAAIFLKAADLLAGPYRHVMNAATMLGQSKTAHQAEIDAACEMIDFFRFNARYAQEIYEEQPESSAGCWNRLEQRPQGVGRRVRNPLEAQAAHSPIDAGKRVGVPLEHRRCHVERHEALLRADVREPGR